MPQLSLSTISFALGCLAALAWSSRMPVASSMGRIRFFLVISLATGAFIIQAGAGVLGAPVAMLAVSSAAISFFLTLALVLRCRDVGIGTLAAGFLMFVPGGILIPAFFRGMRDGERLTRSPWADGAPAMIFTFGIFVMANSYALTLVPMMAAHAQ